MVVAWIPLAALLLWTSAVHAYQLIPRHVPLISQHHLDTVPWRPEYMKLTRGEHMYVYHNYTGIDTGNGQQQYRHLGREVIPHYRRILRTFLEPAEPISALSKRGFIANPDVPEAVAKFLLPPSIQPPIQLRYLTWNWKRESPSCALRIQFCFRTVEVQQRLRNILVNAIAKWHNALGPARGVSFELVPGDRGTGALAELCRDAQGQWRGEVPTDTIEIGLSPGRDKTYNSIGWKPGREPGRMQIAFGLGYPENIPNHLGGAGMRNTYDNHAMAHELGHVLGLEHEHQRYDAPEHIRYFLHNLRHFGVLDQRIAEYNRRKNTQLTRNDVLSDRTVALKLVRELGDGGPELLAIVPFVAQNDPIELVDLKEVGEFDWESIMLYSSWAFNRGGTNKNDAVMRKRSDDSIFGNFWFVNNLISDGDVAAVKRIYPDIPQPASAGNNDGDGDQQMGDG